MSPHFFSIILGLLIIAVFVTAIFHRLNIPTIVGFILVGIAAGPYGLSWVQDTQAVRGVAELGIVFLLFTIGLEFSLSNLIAMRHIVFLYGGLQVLLSLTITGLIGIFFNMNLPTLTIVGAIVAMSSTAIVTKQLIEQTELPTQHGMNAFGILLFQDLAVIPILILIPSLLNVGVTTVLYDMVWALVKALIAITAILLIGKEILTPLFFQIAKRHSPELFTLTVLLVTLGSAWVTSELGLSLSLGAFLAGMMLGETAFRHQIDDAISPFRDVLVAFFFISVGMQFNPQILIKAWPWILLLLSALIVFKTILITILGRLLHNDFITSLRTGLLLSQGGEFGLAILFLADNYNLLSKDYLQVMLGGILISMIIAPVIILFNKQIAFALLNKKGAEKFPTLEAEIAKHVKRLSNHVIICGFGRVGQNIAHLLDDLDIRYIAFDLDPIRVQDARLAGDQVYYANITHYSILKAANIDKAHALVITFDNIEEALKIIQQVRHDNTRVPIMTRGRDEQDAKLFYEAGASEVIPEALEFSLLFAAHVMLFMNLSIDAVKKIITKIRADRYDVLLQVFPDVIESDIKEMEELQQGLRAIILPEHAYAVRKKLADLPLEKWKVKIIKIRRYNKLYRNPGKNFILRPYDVIVLFGNLQEIEEVSAMFLKGR